MASPNLIDALRITEAINMKKKTKILRGDTAKNVLNRVSKKEDTTKKDRPVAEKRKAMYGKE